MVAQLSEGQIYNQPKPKGYKFGSHPVQNNNEFFFRLTWLDAFIKHHGLNQYN
jgi:hypothetical protein